MNRLSKFKGFCAEHNISQRELADVLGISIQSANKKVNGKIPMTLNQIKVLCEHYQISADEYFM